MSSAADSSSPRSPIVLFDGDCGLCDRSVRFLLKRDRRGLLRFAPLQSALGRRLLREHGLPEGVAARSGSFALIDRDGRAHQRSAAARRALRHLGGGWRLAAALLGAVPAPVGDALYDWVARHRRRWFPARSCAPLSRDERSRFLSE